MIYVFNLILYLELFCIRVQMEGTQFIKQNSSQLEFVRDVSL